MTEIGEVTDDHLRSLELAVEEEVVVEVGVAIEVSVSLDMVVLVITIGGSVFIPVSISSSYLRNNYMNHYYSLKIYIA